MLKFMVITGTAAISLLLVTKLNAQSITLDGLARTHWRNENEMCFSSR
jgi:hypothetical protein